MKKYLLLILAILFFLFPSVSRAQIQPENQLRISPVLLNIILSPGKTYTYVITIENLQDTPVPLRASLDSLSTDEDGTFDFVAPKKSPLVDWTTISPQEILVPANDVEKVTVTVRIPDSVQLGGYYAFLFLDPVISRKQTASTVTARIGIPLLANIGVIDNTKNHTNIESFSFVRKIVETPVISTRMRITNNGLHHYPVKPALIVKPLLGEPFEVPFEEKVLFPGKGRRWEVTKTLPNLYPGYYNSSMRVSTGNGDQLFYDDYFVILPYKMAITLFFLLTIVIFISTRRKQIVAAIKIIFNKE